MISIIIPVYNTEPYLDECINSVVEQTYADIEIILVNDGSTDNSADICNRWATIDKRIQIISQENQGISAARNTGIKNAKGDYLYFLDSDDHIAPNLCERIMNIFNTNDIDIVVFGLTKFNNNAVLPSEYIQFNGILSSNETLQKLVTGQLPDYAWNKMYKKSVFENVWFPVGHNFEDTGTIYKTILNSKKIYFTTDKYYFYRVRKGSIISIMSDNTLRDIFLMRNMRYNDLKEVYPDIAKLCLPHIAISALRFYDRSLWSNVDNEALGQAVSFLKSKKKFILAESDHSSRYVPLRFYYTSPFGYKTIRLLKHKIGNIVKKIKK